MGGGAFRKLNEGQAKPVISEQDVNREKLRKEAAEKKAEEAKVK